MRTARENPIGFSKGDPEEMLWRMMVFLSFSVVIQRFLFDQNPPFLVEEPEIFYRSGERLFFRLFIFFRVEENRTNRRRPCPAAP